MTDFQQKERLRLGILFYFNQTWMGGILYIVNLLKTLDFLEDEEKPEITLFYNPDLKKYVDQIKYSYISLIPWKYPSIFNGYFKSWFYHKNIFICKILNIYDLHVVYPLLDYPLKIKSKTKLIGWYADLQHKYYPEFFTLEKRIQRNFRVKFLLKNADQLVVSSYSAKKDFQEFYPQSNSFNIHVFNFVSVVDEISGLNISELREKYNLPEKYFMVSNQFYKHKNHIVIFLAMAFLKKQGIKIFLAITGKLPAERCSDYIKELQLLINENNLHSQISLMGVIQRNHQLMLMKHSQAVIQPSLFEGWSTVIEDAKSLQVPVIASSIQVNIEQLGSEGVFFDPFDYKKLAYILKNFPDRDMNHIFYEDYHQRIRTAARAFLSILSSK